MKEFGNTKARGAAVLCTKFDCRQNSALVLTNPEKAKETARTHEGGGHEAVIVYLDKDHPLSHEDAIQVESVSGVPFLDELIS